MIPSALFGALLLLAALVELLVPGLPIYHAGWLNALIAAGIVFMAMGVRRVLTTASSARQRWFVAIAAVAVAVVGFDVVVSGLLGPDARTIVAAPGQAVRVDELGGSLVFPIGWDKNERAQIALRGPAGSTPVGARRYVGSFLLQPLLRHVVAVDVTDARGGHLTVTQPTGAAFLSPVLLMQQRQTIAGMSVPYDAFNVPAAHRVVKAVLFSADRAAQLPGLHGARPAVLFDVENASEAEIPGGIGAAHSGERIMLGGIGLRPTIFSYPALRVVSVPNVPVSVIAALLALAAAAAAVWEARRAKSDRPVT